MKYVNVLSVCGSGTVTSSMVAGKVKETLKEKGISVSTTEARPTEALNLAESGRFDLIVYTSPLPAGDYKIPTINAFACLTGMGEDKFFEDLLKTVDELNK
ncbi:PTS sugar transporter subunit IIB [Clostridium sp. BL-8]|uniref:PTS sugar transporter subunit IIB n=1 Tax=Clostridium sp. BL-8 TaxID=349938 RepID=UPI00098CC1D3|nr:PTS sugar transporter subunit IIB [Clostridium sp. BL-8]OOM75690.1 PTS system, lactose/cellobiose specific IIB subunit [Clostridium sp. BL-8]